MKYAACNALGQMSSDFAPRLQEQHHSQIVPALLVVLEESTNLRVKTHAGAALVNFCEPCPTDILVQYLPAIMPKLEGLLQLGLKEVSALSLPRYASFYLFSSWLRIVDG